MVLYVFHDLPYEVIEAQRGNCPEYKAGEWQNSDLHPVLSLQLVFDEKHYSNNSL